MVALQLSGIHMHVDGSGYVGVPEGAHLHSAFVHEHGEAGIDHPDPVAVGHPHEHDQEFDGAKDVSLFELVSGASKQILALVWFALVLPLLLWQAARLLPTFALPVRTGRRTRWRPPLRAPPQIA